MNQTVYKDILRRLMRQCVTRGRPFWEAHAWTLHHDNTPDHAALSIGQFIAERNIAILEYPHILKRAHFSDIDSIKMAATTELKKIPENAFPSDVESSKRRMHKCFKVEGDYFEGI